MWCAVILDSSIWAIDSLTIVKVSMVEAGRTCNDHVRAASFAAPEVYHDEIALHFGGLITQYSDIIFFSSSCTLRS